MTQTTAFFPLGGGLDLVTPAIAIQPGHVVAALNYEPVLSGYRRFGGYERFDGHISPSSARVCAVRFLDGNAATEALVAGTEIFQQPDGFPRSATGWALAPPILTGGSFADGDAVGYILMVPTKGEFVEGETLREGDPIGTQYGAVEVKPDTGIYDPLDLLRIARNLLRQQISQVPGSGPIRGIWFDRDRAYAVRDNEAGTAGVPYYSELNSEALVTTLSVGGDTISVGGLDLQLSLVSEGWTQAVSESVINFTAGLEEPAEGATITQGGASAIVRRVVVSSGTFLANNAVGRCYVVDPSGIFTAGAVNVGGTPVFTATGAATINNFPPGGRYQFITENFYGSENLTRIYGVNGVGPAFEFDGTTIVEIPTGMNDDRPTRIAAYKKALFLSFPGGSLQFSLPGEPRNFDPILGAAEIGVGSEITDLLPLPDSLAIFSESAVHALYGSDKDDFQLAQLTDEAGGLAWSAQRIGQAVYLDNRGLRSLTATAAYGNFSVGTLSQLIEPLLADLRRDQVSPTASLIVRSRSQYWLFFADGTAIVFLFGKKTVEAMPINMGVKVTCAASIEDGGVERVFLGGDDGFVYELGKGQSYDGAAIDFYLRLPYNHFGTPQVLKRAHKVTVDMEATPTTEINAAVAIDAGRDETDTIPVDITTGHALDNTDFYELYFASQIETYGEAYIGTAGKSFSLKLSGSTDVEEVHTVTGVTYHVSPRGLRR